MEQSRARLMSARPLECSNPLWLQSIWRNYDDVYFGFFLIDSKSKKKKKIEIFQQEKQRRYSSVGDVMQQPKGSGFRLQ